MSRLPILPHTPVRTAALVTVALVAILLASSGLTRQGRQEAAAADLAPPPQATPGTKSTASPQGTGAPAPAANATGTALPANSIQSTIAAVSSNSITVYGPSGSLQTYPVEGNVTVVRNSKPSSLTDLQATDSVVIRRDKKNKITGILAISAESTAVATLTAGPQATGTAGPQPAGTAGLAGTPTPGANTYTGSVQKVDGAALTISGDDGTTRTVNTANQSGLTIDRDGNTASVGAIRTGDDIVVTYGANQRPTRIEATSLGPDVPSGLDRKWVWYTLLLLVPFLLLLLLLSGQREGRPFLVRRRSRQ